MISLPSHSNEHANIKHCCHVLRSEHRSHHRWSRPRDDHHRRRRLRDQASQERIESRCSGSIVHAQPRWSEWWNAWTNRHKCKFNSAQWWKWWKWQTSVKFSHYIITEMNEYHRNEGEENTKILNGVTESFTEYENRKPCSQHCDHPFPHC